MRVLGDRCHPGHYSPVNMCPRNEYCPPRTGQRWELSSAGLVGGKMSIMKQASTFGVATRDYERTAFFAHEVLIQFMLLDSLP